MHYFLVVLVVVNGQRFRRRIVAFGLRFLLLLLASTDMSVNEVLKK
jgi:hypothetical protein